MWKCTRCQATNDSNKQFCSKCGAPNKASRPTQPVQQHPPKSTPRPAQSAAPPQQRNPAPAQPAAKPSTQQYQPSHITAAQKRVMKAAEMHVEQFGVGEEEPDEAINWDSASALADSFSTVQRKREEEERFGPSYAQNRGAAAAPSSVRVDTTPRRRTALDELPRVEKPHERALDTHTLPITLGLIIAALVLVVVCFAVSYSKLSDEVNSFSPYENTGTPTLFSHQLRASSINGMWVGTDHASPGDQGTPVKYIFTAPGWLVVLSGSAAATEASFKLDGKTFTTVMQPGGGAGAATPPSQATITVKNDTLTLTDGARTLVLKRPQAIVGTWSAATSGASDQSSDRYVFSSNGSANISSAQTKAQSGSYHISGNTISINPPGQPQPALPTWSFTFDGEDLILTPLQPTGGAQIRLKRQR